MLLEVDLVRFIMVLLYLKKLFNFSLGLYNCKEVAIKEQIFELNFLPQELIALRKELSIMSYCKHKSIGNILAIHFDSKNPIVWII